MSFARLALAAALASAAAVPTGAQAFVQICAYPAPGVYICHAPEQPGCERAGVGDTHVKTAACG